ncbi:MAG: SOS response-associated peptidase family protein [Nitrospiria bacterium]
MPVILDRADEENWLDPENTNMKELQKLLKPCPSDWLEAYEISTLVNSPRNNSPKVLQPVS